jgi:hypothetical protein
MAQVLTIEEAKTRLDQDIAKAHDLYERRVARIREMEQRPLPEPGKSNGGKDWSRYEQALSLREGGAKLSEVGQALGVSVSRARMMIKSAERHRSMVRADRPMGQLPIRAYNILVAALGKRRGSDFTRQEVATTITLRQLKDINNCGAGTINAIRRWLQQDDLDLRIS